MEHLNVRAYNDGDKDSVDELDWPNESDYRQLFGTLPQDATKTASTALVLTTSDSYSSKGQVIAFLAATNLIYKSQTVLPGHCEAQAYLAQDYVLNQQLRKECCLVITSFIQREEYSHGNVVASFFHSLFESNPKLEKLLFAVKATTDLEKIEMFAQCFTGRNSVITISGCHLHIYHANRDQLSNVTSKNSCIHYTRLSNVHARDLWNPCESTTAVESLGNMRDSFSYALDSTNNKVSEKVEKSSRPVSFLAYKLGETESMKEEVGVVCATDDFDHLPEDTHAHREMHAILFGKIYRQHLHSKQLQLYQEREGSRKPLRICVCGPPVSGKGMCSMYLAKQFGVLYLSMEGLLRSHAVQGTQIGQRAQIYMDAGEAVPDKILIKILFDRMKLDDCQKFGWVLDGFPRTDSQASLMAACKIVPDALVILHLPEDVIVDRILGRRVDPLTGKQYHIRANPPPNHIMHRLVMQTDDSELAIRRRLASFYENCVQLQAIYAKLCVNLISIDATDISANMQHRIEREVCRLKQWLRPLRLRSPPRLIIVGPPAGGKGTQCEMLVQAFGVVHLSAGNILRDAIQQKLDVGLQAEEFMNAGKLVPDHLMIDLILSRLHESDCEQFGWLLDGFPRTEAQATAMLDAGLLPDAILVLEVPDEEVISRISGRLIDPVTNATYHKVTNPPPSSIQDRCITRKDDTEQVLKVRLQNFHANINQILEVLGPHSDILPQNGTKGVQLIASHYISAIEQLIIRKNCIAITQFRVENDDKLINDQCILRFIASMFARYPTRDYILLCLPEGSRAFDVSNVLRYRKMAASAVHGNLTSDFASASQAPSVKQSKTSPMSGLYGLLRQRIARQKGDPAYSISDASSLSPQGTIASDSTASDLDAQHELCTPPPKPRTFSGRLAMKISSCRKTRGTSRVQHDSVTDMNNVASPSENLVLYVFHRDDLPYVCQSVPYIAPSPRRTRAQILQEIVKGIRQKRTFGGKVKQACI